MYQEKIVDVVTGEETFRPYTKEEIAAVEAAIAQAKDLQAQSEQKNAAKAALLDRLGITAEEAALLLG
jgi:hypothetical protein